MLADAVTACTLVDSVHCGHLQACVFVNWRTDIRDLLIPSWRKDNQGPTDPSLLNPGVGRECAGGYSTSYTDPYAALRSSGGATTPEESETLIPILPV